MRFAPVRLAVILSFAVATIVGCGSGSAPVGSPITPVKGKVSIKGKPVTKGILIFEPESAGRDASATIQPDGSYVAEGDGAAIGSNRVYISGVRKSDVPLKYASASSSGMKIEVKAEQAVYDINFN